MIEIKSYHTYPQKEQKEFRVDSDLGNLPISKSNELCI